MNERRASEAVSPARMRHGCLIRTSARLALLSACILCATAEVADAATGDQIFSDAACTLLRDVLTGNDGTRGFFGAMLTVIAGSLAILAATMGSFKGAWVLLFVSVATYTMPPTVHILFPGLCQGPASEIEIEQGPPA